MALKMSTSVAYLLASANNSFNSSSLQTAKAFMAAMGISDEDSDDDYDRFLSDELKAQSRMFDEPFQIPSSPPESLSNPSYESNSSEGFVRLIEDKESDASEIAGLVKREDDVKRREEEWSAKLVKAASSDNADNGESFTKYRDTPQT